MDTREEEYLTLLPVDAQACILSFLGRHDLIHFAAVSRGCQGVATMERLWIPLLGRHFGNAALPDSSFANTFCQFRALALSPCNTCNKVLLLALPRAITTRYPTPHLCDLCNSLCCTTCHCQCHCLDLACDGAMSRGDITLQCYRCGGWAHYNCNEVGFCRECSRSSCATCDVFFRCVGYHCQLCPDCQDLLDENGQIACADCSGEFHHWIF
jgi:hypothetical protein